MFLVVDHVLGRLSCKFRAGYHGGMIGHNNGRVLKSVVLISCYCIFCFGSCSRKVTSDSFEKELL
jgi:hypothetical protein